MACRKLYMFRQDLDKWILLEGRAQKYIAEEIGISKHYLNNVIKGKQLCTRVVAYAITKCVSRDKKIEDLFIIKEK